MNVPLMNLRAFLVVLFGAAPVERFVDPVLGDVHAEHLAATNDDERRAIRARGTWLVMRAVPSLAARVEAGSFVGLVAPLMGLASIGILAMAREPEVARFAAAQSLWLGVALVAAAAFALAARGAGRFVAPFALVVGFAATALAVSPLATIDGATIHVSRPFPLAPLQITWPFVMLAWLAGGTAAKRLASGLALAVTAVATLRGAVGDACFAWVIVAAEVARYRRLGALLAPAGLALTLALAPLSVWPVVDPHTDGIVDTILRHGGVLGLALAGGFLMWTKRSWTRQQGPHRDVARAFGLAFAGVVALAFVARLGGLPAHVASVAGLGYGGSALFMLLGAAGALAGANNRATRATA